MITKVFLIKKRKKKIFFLKTISMLELIFIKQKLNKKYSNAQNKIMVSFIS